MKKLFFALFVTVLCSTVPFAQSTVDITDNSGGPKIHIEFGRKSMDCRGFGICVVKITVTFQDIADIFEGLANREGKFKIQFSQATYNKYKAAFPNNTIVVDEDYILDRETSRGIGLNDGYTIKKGSYKIVFDKSTNTYNCTF